MVYYQIRKMNIFISIMVMLFLCITNVYCNTESEENDMESSGEFSYDHNVILGKDQSALFAKLSTEDKHTRLSEIFDKMDLNKDGQLNLNELKKWIGSHYNGMLEEDVDEHWTKYSGDGKPINFDHYREETYGHRDMSNDDPIIQNERRRWREADLNHDELLNKTELFRFLHPETFVDMRSVLAQENLEAMDKNNDSYVDINEYIEEQFPPGTEAKEEWLNYERQNFGLKRDLNKDGFLDRDEIQQWLLPKSYDRVDAEARHILDVTDTDMDQVITKSEVLKNYRVFIGKEHESERPDITHEDL